METLKQNLRLGYIRRFTEKHLWIMIHGTKSGMLYPILRYREDTLERKTLKSILLKAVSVYAENPNKVCSWGENRGGIEWTHQDGSNRTKTSSNAPDIRMEDISAFDIIKSQSGVSPSLSDADEEIRYMTPELREYVIKDLQYYFKAKGYFHEIRNNSEIIHGYYNNTM